MRGKLQVSQCMIVKNEERNIRRALEWGKGIFCEQIVVDTGSTDQTAELAREMGAKVYHFQWINDFSAAKNYALEQAHGDWIAFLDADEYPDKETVCMLLPALEECRRKGLDGLGTAMANLDDQGKPKGWGTLVRFFRNDPQLRYCYPIHEQLRYTDGRLPRVLDATKRLTILHTGYAGQVYEEKRRSGRNRSLLESALSENPDSYELLGYLGDEYYEDGNFEKAEEYYLLAVKGMPEELSQDDQRSSSTYLKLMCIFSAKSQREEMAQLYCQAVRHFPQDGDFDYVMGNYFAEIREYVQGAEYLRKALDKMGKYGCRNRSQMLAANLAGTYECLVVCDYHCGKLKEAVQTASALLKEKPYNMKVLYILLLCFQKEQIVDAKKYTYAKQVADFLSKMYNFTSLKDRLFVRKAAGEAGYLELQQVMEDMLNEEERRLLRESDREVQ